MLKRPVVLQDVLIAICFGFLIYGTTIIAEKLTLTSYYPSPYGVYKELRSTKKTLLATTPITTDANSMVGIGTTNPTSKLYVLGDTHIEGRLRVFGSGPSGNSKLVVTQENVNDAAIIAADEGSSWLRTVPRLGAGGWNSLSQADDIGLIFSNDAQNTGNLVIGPWGAGGGIRITNTGNVGIGTYDPQSTLDVAGSLNVSGSISAGKPICGFFYEGTAGLSNGYCPSGYVDQGAIVVANYVRVRNCASAATEIGDCTWSNVDTAASPWAVKICCRQ
ncbi:hypothetical protein ACFL6Y_09515 [Elusimicrobiota bacterium]